MTFNFTQAQIAHMKETVIKAKELFIYDLSLHLGLDPEDLMINEVVLPEENHINYPSYLVLVNNIRILKSLKEII